ncbi:cytochrome c [Bacillus shivajii]|nr:cytochrome c [Bacillus shivajii]UCZ54010.1 cytochrome c [Bacillus shivajii]
MYITKEEIHLMLDHLSDDEIQAVYEYIHSLKGKRSEKKDHQT